MNAPQYSCLLTWLCLVFTVTEVALTQPRVLAAEPTKKRVEPATRKAPAKPKPATDSREIKELKDAREKENRAKEAREKEQKEIKEKEDKEQKEKERKEKEDTTVDQSDPDEKKYELDEKDPTGDHYTSIIIDASDYHITRSMSPKICREEGAKVWPCLAYIDPEFVLSYGIVIYTRSLDEAKEQKRAGKNPLVVRATGRGKSSDDPIVSEEDAKAMLAANKRNLCMDKFKVIFILDKQPTSAGTETAAK